MYYRKYGTKYNNKRTIYNGNYYDSKLEAGYAQYLDLQLKAGLIKGWRRQVTKHLEVNGVRVCSYRLDFEVDHNNGVIEYVEVKGFWTPQARLKVKLFQAIYGVKVTVVKSIPKTYPQLIHN